MRSSHEDTLMTMAIHWLDNGVAHINVRGLPPPGPLVAILRLVDARDAPARVIVHHDRDPLLLYPELAERHWTVLRITAPDGEVRLQLERGE